MVIQTGNVIMGSTHKLVTYQAESVSYTRWGEVSENVRNNTASTLPSAKDSAQETEISNNSKQTREELLDKLTQGGRTAENRLLAQEDDSIYEGESKVEYNSLKNLMMLLFAKQDIETEKVTPATVFMRLMSEQRERLDKILEGMGYCTGIAPAPSQEWGSEFNITTLQQEKETTEFTTTGNVVTGDGKKIQFDVTAVMSRSYMSYSSLTINYGAAKMIDPLVISLDSEPVGLSDKKFLFDLDADGTEDNISLLARNCGFLALDKNEDGIINDGSELFGAKTGDGFKELAIFDFDGNGWIDEGDEVFNRLRIWTKDESGNDKLIALGIAGIGAIYLGNAATEFSVNSMADNSVNGTVRKTGIYLTEEGEAKLIQHVDMAVS